MTGFGQKWSLAKVLPNVGFPIINRSSGRIVAAQYEAILVRFGASLERSRRDQFH
jgi:hypothetical protein